MVPHSRGPREASYFSPFSFCYCTLMGFCIFILSSRGKYSVPSVGLAAFSRSYQTSWFLPGGRGVGENRTSTTTTRRSHVSYLNTTQLPRKNRTSTFTNGVNCAFSNCQFGVSNLKCFCVTKRESIEHDYNKKLSNGWMEIQYCLRVCKTTIEFSFCQFKYS